MTVTDKLAELVRSPRTEAADALAAENTAARGEEGNAVVPPANAREEVEYPDPPRSYPPELYEPTNFPEMQNDLLLRAATCQPDLPRSPVWVMRQAGRYLPEFRAVRKRHGFFEICRSPELAAEITLQPTRRYKGLLDAAIIFSDILVIPQAMGMEVRSAIPSLLCQSDLTASKVQMLPDVGPHFPKPIKTVEEAVKLATDTYDVKESLAYVYKALTLTRHLLKGQVPLIGFCGAPWTLMAYMIEGGGSKTFIKAKSFLFTHPKESSALLHKIGEVAAHFLVEQIRAGAQLVQIFDSWAGELSPQDFRDFELPVLVEMLRTVREATKDLPHRLPVTCFAKGANYAIPYLADAGFDVVGLDWCVDPAEARETVGDRPVALQGNLDPTTLYAGLDKIEERVKRMFLGEKGFLSTPEGRKYGHIANLGHGITPAVDPAAMKRT